jgi:tape measure domain-containing protein
MPSLEGLSDLLSKEFRKAIPAIKDLGDILGTSFTAGIGEKLAAEISKAAGGAAPLTEALQRAVEGLGEQITEETENALPAAGQFGAKLKKSIAGIDGIIKGIFRAGTTITAPFNKALLAGVRAAGKGLSDTLNLATKTAVTGLATGIGAVSGQALAGGLDRALGINAASAKLQALGYQGAEFDSIMKSAADSVDGTAFALNDSVGSSASLLAAGIKPGEELTGILKNAAKLADISGSSFGEMGSILAKNAASGVVQMEDLNQLMDRGVPITSYLAKNLGKSVAEIKKMSSEGDITFGNLNDAINSIDFDSALLASRDVGLAFRNLRSQLSKQGAKLWTPIIDGLLPIIITARKLIIEFGNSFNFTPIQTKLSEAMAKIGTVFDRFKNVGGEIDSSKVTAVLDEITAKFEKFKGIIKGFEGPIVGIIAGMSASLLSGIPVIGPAFAGITPLVGLFAGTLIQAYQKSENLRNTIKSLGGWLTGLGTTFATVFAAKGSTNPMGEFGDKLAVGIEWLKTLVTGIVETLVARGPEIMTAIESVWTAITGALGNGAPVDGKAIGGIIVDTITTFAGYVATIVPILIDLTKQVTKVLTSDAATAIFNWIAGVAKTVAANEGLLLALGGTLATLFIGGKLAGPLLGMIDFFGRFKLPPAAAAAGPAMGTTLGGFVKGLATVFKAVVTNLHWILLGIAAFALILGAFALIGFLIETTGAMAGLKSFGDVIIEIGRWVAGVVSQLVNSIMPGVDKIISLAETLVDKLAGVWTAIAGAFEFKASFTFNTADIAPIVDSISRLFSTLADKGLAAGVGAYAAAAGIGALLLALGGGSAAAGAGNLIGTIFSGIAGEGNPLEEMLQAVERLAAVNAVVLSMPISWGSVLEAAVVFGLAIPTAIAAGIEASGGEIRSALGSQIDTMLTEAQNRLDSTPLLIRAELDDNAASLSSGGIRSTSGNTSTNKTTIYNVAAPGENSFQAFLRSGR